MKAGLWRAITANIRNEKGDPPTDCTERKGRCRNTVNNCMPINATTQMKWKNSLRKESTKAYSR